MAQALKMLRKLLISIGSFTQLANTHLLNWRNELVYVDVGLLVSNTIESHLFVYTSLSENDT